MKAAKNENTSGCSQVTGISCPRGILSLLGLLVVAAILASGLVTESSASDADTKTEWVSLQIVDVQSLPWDTNPRFGGATKTFFRGPETGSFVYWNWSPTWDTTLHPDPLGSHYHLWDEWALSLDGDFVIQEPVSPYQDNGVLNRFTGGTWLDRPAYSLHGGSWATGGLRSQNPGSLIIYEEGDGSVVTVGPKGDHFKPDFPDKPVPYEPDWKAVEQFTRPWIVDSASKLEWEADTEVPGRFVKWLSDDLAGGFRAQLVKIPPGWTPPKRSRKTYFHEANRMRYMLFGDMQVWSFDGPDSAGAATTVGKDVFVYQPAGSIWGYGGGPVSEQGAIWLEVTYAKGVSHGGGRIEEPVEIR